MSIRREMWAGPYTDYSSCPVKGRLTDQLNLVGCCHLKMKGQEERVILAAGVETTTESPGVLKRTFQRVKQASGNLGFLYLWGILGKKNPSPSWLFNRGEMVGYLM